MKKAHQNKKTQISSFVIKLQILLGVILLTFRSIVLPRSSSGTCRVMLLLLTDTTNSWRRSWANTSIMPTSPHSFDNSTFTASGKSPKRVHSCNTKTITFSGKRVTYIIWFEEKKGHQSKTKLTTFY